MIVKLSQDNYHHLFLLLSSITSLYFLKMWSGFLKVIFFSFSFFCLFETTSIYRSFKYYIITFNFYKPFGTQSHTSCPSPSSICVCGSYEDIILYNHIVTIKIRKVAFRHYYHLFLRSHSDISRQSLCLCSKISRTESSVTLSCRIPLVSIDLEEFVHLYLTFIFVTLLRITGNMVQKMLLNFSLPKPHDHI